MILPVTLPSRFLFQRVSVGTPFGAFFFALAACFAFGTGTDLLMDKASPSPNSEMVLLG